MLENNVKGYFVPEMLNGHAAETVRKKLLGNQEISPEKKIMAESQLPLDKFAPWQFEHNPAHKNALTIGDLKPGRAITIFTSGQGGAPKPYLQCIVESEPFFDADNLWWVLAITKDRFGIVEDKFLCLGVLGITTTDRAEENGRMMWNDQFFALYGILKSAEESPAQPQFATFGL